MSILANLTPAEAELLVEAHESRGFGVELGGTFDHAEALSLEIEGLGHARLEWIGEGADAVRVSVFRINDAGAEWLDNAGKLEG